MNDYMGECEIDIGDCLKNAGKWIIDKSFTLSDPEKKAPKENPVSGYIYLQAKYSEGAAVDVQNAPPLRAEFTKKEEKKAEEEAKAAKPGKETKETGKAEETKSDIKIKGNLKVHAVCARDLKIGDWKTSDPFCRITFLKTTQKTNKVGSTLNPDWKKTLTFPVALKDIVSNS
jgi:hypothetical protein